MPTLPATKKPIFTPADETLDRNSIVIIGSAILVWVSVDADGGCRSCTSCNVMKPVSSPSRRRCCVDYADGLCRTSAQLKCNS